MTDQTPERGVEGASRQGMYCLTTSGILLASKNHQDADSVRELLEQGLAAWNRLPDGERRPGAIKIPDPGRIDARHTRTPPEGGLILNVYTRILDRDRSGNYARGSCTSPGGDLSARDRMWLRRGEWQALVPMQAKEGDHFDMPAALAERLLRYHLVDNTRGEPSFWSADQVRRRSLTWTVVSATDKELRLRLEGSALLATRADAGLAERGYDVRLTGVLNYDRVRKVIDRFDVVAVGDHWGEGEFTQGARPGRKPLGIAFELADGKRPADRIPPQAARDLEDYLGREP